MVIGTLTMPQLNVYFRPLWTPCTAVPDRPTAPTMLCKLLSTKAMLVDRTVMLALALTVTLRLVRVSVGVLPTLLFITVTRAWDRVVAWEVLLVDPVVVLLCLCRSPVT